MKTLIHEEDFTYTAALPPDYKVGGQHVGVPVHIITATHIPTGLSASCGVMRSQHENRRLARFMVETGLMEYWTRP